MSALRRTRLRPTTLWTDSWPTLTSSARSSVSTFRDWATSGDCAACICSATSARDPRGGERHLRPDAGNLPPFNHPRVEPRPWRDRHRAARRRHGGYRPDGARQRAVAGAAGTDGANRRRGMADPGPPLASPAQLYPPGRKTGPLIRPSPRDVRRSGYPSGRCAWRSPTTRVASAAARAHRPAPAPVTVDGATRVVVPTTSAAAATPVSSAPAPMPASENSTPTMMRNRRRTVRSLNAVHRARERAVTTIPATATRTERTLPTASGATSQGGAAAWPHPNHPAAKPPSTTA